MSPTLQALEELKRKPYQKANCSDNHKNWNSFKIQIMQIQVICMCRSITCQQWDHRHKPSAAWLGEIRPPPCSWTKAGILASSGHRKGSRSWETRPSRICRCFLCTSREVERCLSNTGSTPACHTPEVQGGKSHVLSHKL